MKTFVNITLIVCAWALFATQSYAYKNLEEKKNEGKAREKSSFSGCVTPSAATIFDYNNVRALIFTGGDMWWDLQSNPFYEIPKGSGKHSLFAGAIWIGGTDVNNQLRVSAARYRNGQDYYTGPLKAYGNDRGNTTAEMCTKYDKHFPISKFEVETFRSWWRAVRDNNTELLNTVFANYQIPDNIKNWPAINPEPDYSYFLAPFWDENQDGFYNPEDGDYPFYDLDKEIPCGTTPDKRRPRLYGDKTIWWVYNDRGNIHTESDGASIGMEIQAQYFAFATNDELNNMTFGNYALINRSTYTLQDCYFGVWTDADLGDAWDDYVGTDVNRGLGYLYNGDENDGDGNGITYGSQPPAIGVDFFEGPYQDPDGKDNLSNWVWNQTTGQRTLDCQRTPIVEGSINGLNFEDGVIDDERWGMRRFLYFNNGGCAQCDPQTAVEYYRYLRGFWKDGTRMTFGGNGYGGSVPADFMFPDDSDPCAWGTAGIQQPVPPYWNEKNVNNQPYDRRFVQSAGPFTLLPGATNDITVGMVWARANSGGAWGSVQELKRADDKAQRLFEVCFKLVDGPNAPELKIIELDQELIFHIYNYKGSNNYQNKPGDYEEVDPFIVCPNSTPNCDVKYRFQGYQVFQLKDQSCNVNDIGNEDKARLVFQCDIKDSVARIVNFVYDNQIGYAVPKVMVNGADAGIFHTFRLTDDAFATGDKRLVNHKSYYYVAIAYAYNNFKKYDPLDPNALDGQKLPYLASRMGYGGGAIRVYSAMPHKSEPANSGTILNSAYGYGPKITQVDGHGNGNNPLRLTKATIDAILNAGTGKVSSVEYENNYGPIQVKVVDPLNVQPYDFMLKFIPDTNYSTSAYNITESKWMLVKTTDTKPGDTVYSESSIKIQNEQLIPKWGISITITQVPWPLKDDKNAYQNGYLSSSITFEDPKKQWLDFIQDQDGCDFPNWIRSGSLKSQDDANCNDFTSGTTDKQQFFEKIIDGKWAPYSMAMMDKKATAGGPAHYKGIQFYRRIDAQLATDKKRLTSVLIVITKDKTKWSRCPVIEMADLDLESGFVAGLGETNTKKYELRRAKSVDKDGRNDNLGSSTDPSKSNYISDYGMGWFPGYAIDMTTGERLNIAFGENSRWGNQNGRDMLWNPTSEYADNVYFMSGGQNGNLYIGGQHVIYVFGHNDRPSNSATFKDTMPAYDEGRYIVGRLKELENLTGSTYETRMSFMWANAMWVSIPMLNPLLTKPSNVTDPYWFIQTDVKIEINIGNPYQVRSQELQLPNAPNQGFPMYTFSLKEVAPIKNDLPTAKEALDLIRVVPNPYYGYSGYERSQLENKVRITNLPQKCTISIYNVNGTLIRRFKKDNTVSYQDWDLKNEYGITIASGVYIVHIDAPGIGEKVIKWFGSLRPIDLNNF